MVDGQSFPLVNRPHVFLAFDPSREIVDERGCAVFLIQDLWGFPVQDTCKWAAPMKTTAVDYIISSYRQVLKKRIVLDNYLSSIMVRTDGSVFVFQFEGFYIEIEKDTEMWDKIVVLSMEELVADLEKIGLGAEVAERMGLRDLS